MAQKKGETPRCSKEQSTETVAPIMSGLLLEPNIEIPGTSEKKKKKKLENLCSKKRKPGKLERTTTHIPEVTVFEECFLEAF